MLYYFELDSYYLAGAGLNLYIISKLNFFLLNFKVGNMIDTRSRPRREKHPVVKPTNNECSDSDSTEKEETPRQSHVKNT